MYSFKNVGGGLSPDGGVSVKHLSTDPPSSGASPLPHFESSLQWAMIFPARLWPVCEVIVKISFNINIG
ncbi:hypothetical protein C4J97_4392 [Pseudomonas orientalis]|nr:hypothetical protein C4J97_4392 [Pseudomonas orientalis]